MTKIMPLIRAGQTLPANDAVIAKAVQISIPIGVAMIRIVASGNFLRIVPAIEIGVGLKRVRAGSVDFIIVGQAVPIGIRTVGVGVILIFLPIGQTICVRIHPGITP